MVPNIKVNLTQTRTEWTLDFASSSRTHTTEHMGAWRTFWWNAIYCRCSSLQHLRRKRACTLDPQTSIESKQECNVSCLSAYIPPGLSYKGSLANSNVQQCVDRWSLYSPVPDPSSIYFKASGVWNTGRLYALCWYSLLISETFLAQMFPIRLFKTSEPHWSKQIVF